MPVDCYLHKFSIFDVAITIMLAALFSLLQLLLLFPLPLLDCCFVFCHFVAIVMRCYQIAPTPMLLTPPSASLIDCYFLGGLL